MFIFALSKGVCLIHLLFPGVIIRRLIEKGNLHRLSSLGVIDPFSICIPIRNSSMRINLQAILQHTQRQRLAVEC